MSYLPELFEAKDYATAIKVLDNMAEGAEGVALASVLCNRGLCYQKMDLHRKALKNYDEALRSLPYFSRAHMGRGKSLQALGRTAEAKNSWKAAIDGFSPGDDLQMIGDAIAFCRHPDLSRETLSTMQQAQAPARQPSSFGRTVSPQSSQPSANGMARTASGAVSQQPAQQQVVAERPRAVSGSVSQQPAQQQAVAQRPRMTDATAAIGLAVGHINSGNIEQAITLLDGAISSSSEPNMGALVARGTARALNQDLKGAIEDFSAAIDIYPNYGDCWKRRGQAKSAEGDKEGAITDFLRALELISDNAGRAEIRTEMSIIYQKESNLWRAEKELALAVRLDDRSTSSWNQLGVCRVGLGYIDEGCRCYKKAIALDPKNYEAWLNLALARKEAAQVKEAEAAFKEAFKLHNPSRAGVAIWRMYAHMKQGLGEHMKAIKVLEEGLQLAEGERQVYLTYLKGACNHALGFYKEAIIDYTRAFAISGDNFCEESRQHQALAILQRDLVLYAYNRLDQPVRDFSLDQDIHPVFKELWTHKAPPSPGQMMVCQQRHQRVPSEQDPKPPPPLPDEAATSRLIVAADRMGRLLQNRHQGFLPNKRQHRMGGLAAIELAQAVQEVLEARKKGEKIMVLKGATASLDPHEFGWRDAMDIVVKWRQFSEPNDQVIWVDLLTKQEFERGFGSHTPMFSGQTQCVRYFMNFRRALALLKSILLKEGKAIAANDEPILLEGEEVIESVQRADSPGQLWTAIGQDSYSVVPIQSTLNPDTQLEGTRLTVVKIKGVTDHYEASIRTPVTPSRWKDFDAELTAVWEAVIDALASEDKPKIAVAVLTFVYYWYNFMPLARGTAVCGHITLLSLFALAGMPLTAPIPVDYQVDWEALLQQSPAQFIASLSSWLLPGEALAKPREAAAAAAETIASNDKLTSQTESSLESVRDGSQRTEQDGAASSAEAMTQLEQKLMDRNIIGENSKQASANPIAKAGKSGLENLPSVQALLPTLRNRLEALNGPEVPRLLYP